MRTRWFGFILALSLLCAAEASAQEHPNIAKGNGGPGFGTADIDSVSPFNGNLMIRLPIGQSYPVNAGLSYQLGLVYNSQVWEHQLFDDSTVSIPARGNNAGLGWALHLGRLNPPQLEQNSSPSADFNRNTYLAPDGSLHTFYPTLHEGESATTTVEYTRDGSYLRLKTLPRQIEFPDGSIHTFSSLTNGYLTRMEDRFGNFVQIDYLDCSTSCVSVDPTTATSWRITDTQGRTHWIRLRDTGQPYQSRVITQVDLQAFGGARAVYKFLYNDSTDDQSTTGTPVGLTGCSGSVGSGSNHSIWLLTRLVLPDGSVYDIPKAGYFAFNIPGDASNPCKTGLINRLRLPTLGLIEWDYLLYKFPSTSTGRGLWQKSAGVGVRRLLDAGSTSIGQWTYATALSGGTTAHETLLTNSVTNPAGTKVTRYFSVCSGNCSNTTDGPYEYGLPVARDSGGDGTGRFLSSQTFDSVGALLRTTYTRFEHDLPGTGTTVQERSRLDQRLASQRTAFNDDSAGTVADQTFSDFDGLGHYRHQTDGGNFPGSNSRASHVHYNPSLGTYGQAGYAPWPAASPWVINTYLFSWDQELGKTQYRIPCFESATGFLKRYRILKNSGSAESANDLLQVFQHNAAGNVTVESSYGGDNQSVGFDACNLTPPATPVYQYTHSYSGGVRSQTTVQAGTALSVLDLTIDSSTGQPSISRDAAGKQTFFAYDTSGRLTSASPSDDYRTTYTYCTATSTPACASGVNAEIVTARKGTLTGPEVTAIRQRFDNWGRLISEEERMPPAGAYAARTTAYNALGWTTFTSEQGSSSGTNFLNFDAFGRPRTITPPDGTNHNITLSYQGVRQVTRSVKVANAANENYVNTTEVYDRQGRLYEVTEPNGFVTRYDYDAGNRLSKVCQGATGVGTATCGQQRLFTYDQRGFLLSEQHPEKGASGNGVVSYSNYDARGHAGRKIDGPNDLTFNYDAAERLIQIRETLGGQRVLKSYTYATQNVTDALGTNWSKGKLVSASRFNYVGAPFNGTAEVRDTLSYRGAEGRASDHSRQLIYNGVGEEKFTTTYVYDRLGLVSTLGYPDCVFGDCATLDTPRSLTFNRTYGRLTSVPGVTGTAGGINQITYHSNGLVNQVPHANGLLFTQLKDSSGIARPASLSAGALWSSGSYAYDGSGNVKTIGSQSFLYDNLSRVVQGNLSGNVQSYAFDNYGNIQSITTAGSLQNTPTSSATNRLSSGIYDAAGNLTNWAGNIYEYDPFNNVARYKPGTNDYAYIYGADDERLWIYKVDGTVSIWTLRDLSGRVLRQYNGHLAWSNYEDFVYRDGVLLADLLSDGRQHHYDVDHLGSVRLITDASGAQVANHQYYPFGKELTGLQEAERMKFTGHERDLGNTAGDGDDLDYMHARHYSALTGRFLSTDWAMGHPSDPQSWNRYSYARNSPPNLIDPDGYDPIPPGRLQVYNTFFGHDFSNVNLHTGGLGALVTWAAGLIGGEKWGVTIGHGVYLSPSAVRELESPSLSIQRKAVAALGHELVHVQSNEAIGGAFYFWYGFDLAHSFATGTPVRDLAKAPQLERVAYAAEADMLRDLTLYWVRTSVESCTDWGNCATEVNWYLESQDPFFDPMAHGYQYGFFGDPTADLFLSGAACLEGICL